MDRESVGQPGLADALAQDLITRGVARRETAVGSAGTGPALWSADGRTLIGPDGVNRPMVVADASGRPIDPSGRAAARLPYADIGGSTPGSMPPFSTTIAEEGVLFDNFLLVRGGQLKHPDLPRF